MTSTRNGSVRPLNPYVGPRPFRQGEKSLFFGREAEASSVINTLLSSRIMLLHSPSGAGKTSIIQASVVPAFSERGFLICARAEPDVSALRLNLPPPKDLPVENRYVFSFVNGLIGSSVDRNRACRMTIREAIEEYVSHRGDRARQLLIIDQLEEILTVSPGDVDGQEVFFRQLGEALDDSQRWGLLSIREDYMGGLDHLRRYVPGQLRATHRLDFLRAPAARKAVQAPASRSGVEFEDRAAGLLVDELRTVHTGKTLEDSAFRQYPYVEPVLLQVLCYNLFEKLCREQQSAFTAIRSEDVEAFLPFDSPIRDYYSGVIHDVAKDDRVTERALRDWIEHKLISPGGLRHHTREKPDIPDDDITLSELRGHYLIRDDPRPGGEPFWELSHDMLVKPILDDNRDWRTLNLAPWQVRAEDWRVHGRDKAFLLRGGEYLEAEARAKKKYNPTETDEAFLRASAEAHRDRSLYERSLEKARGNQRALRRQLLSIRLALLLSVLLNLGLLALFIVRR